MSRRTPSARCRRSSGADGLLDDERVADAHALLRELIGQDFDLDEDGVPRLHRGTRADRIISTVDREMRHGRKSQHQRFDGFKLSAAATNTPEPLITAVDVAAGRRPGRSAGQAPHRRSARRAAPAAGAGRHRLRQRAGARRAGRPRRRGACAAARGDRARGRFGQARFPRRPRRRNRDLPGRTDARIRTEPYGTRRASFAKAVCDDCPLRDRCVEPGGGGDRSCSRPTKRS